METTLKIKDLKTEKQLEFIKETFSKGLRKELKLHHVFAPLFVPSGSGINDDLNGTERAIEFETASSKETYTIVHSLAKWKRMRLKELSVPKGEGIITNMIAIRRDETITDIHSYFIDQWDWEMTMDPAERTIEFLQSTVQKIYKQIFETEKAVASEFGEFESSLPETITFIHSEDLLALYPGKTPKERENLITEKFGAVFIIGIGGKLSDGKEHDGRAPDYDDWTSPSEEQHKGLNGDIILWHPELKRAFEVSSMGIRVNDVALQRQLELTKTTSRKELKFHKLLLEGKLPQSIGGGIGQSRICQFMLRKTNIAEVQYCYS